MSDIKRAKEMILEKKDIVTIEKLLFKLMLGHSNDAYTPLIANVAKEISVLNSWHNMEWIKEMNEEVIENKEKD